MNTDELSTSIYEQRSRLDNVSAVLALIEHCVEEDSSTNGTRAMATEAAREMLLNMCDSLKALEYELAKDQCSEDQEAQP